MAPVVTPQLIERPSSWSLERIGSGNQGAGATAFWPSGLDNVFTVAATESGDVRARYSNWGSPVDVAAPGSNILSLRARHTDLRFDALTGFAVVGAGRAPGEWQPSGDPILSPVDNDVIAETEAAELSGSQTWTLRLEVLHENGSRREARFELNLQ